MFVVRWFSCVVVLALALAGASLVRAADVRDKIEVREGDSWTTVTVVRKEGRKTLIRYDDGTEEWVMPDRIKGNSNATPPKAPAGKSDRTSSSSSSDDQTPGPTGSLKIDGPYTELALDDAPEPAPAPAGTKFSLAPATKPSADFTAIPVRRKVEDHRNWIERLVPCVDRPNLAVVSCGSLFMDKPEVILFDLAAKRQVGSHFTTAKRQGVISAAAEGKVLLTTEAQGWNSQIHLWELRGDSYELKANYHPFGDDRGKGLSMAQLLDANRAIFANSAGGMYLVDLKTSKAIGMVHTARDTRPYLHPSGQVLGVITERGTVQIIRMSDFTVITEISGAAPRKTISIDPAATCVAMPIEDKDAVKVVSIADGSQLGVVPGVFSFPFEHMELLSPDKLWAHDDTLFDVKSGLPLWIYKHEHGDPPRLLPSGQLAMLTNSNEGTFICMATIPDSAGKAAEATLLKDKDSFIIHPDAAIAVGDLSAFGREQGNAAKFIAERLKASGLKVADDAAKASAKLVIKVESGPTEQRAYRAREGDDTKKIRVVDCPSTNVTLSIVPAGGGDVAWQHTLKYQAPDPVQIKEGQTLQEAVADYALPHADALRGVQFPTYIVKGATMGSAPALGSSDITPGGIKPSNKPNPPAKPETAKPSVPEKKKVPTAGHGAGLPST